jgi:hypothetical protein
MLTPSWPHDGQSSKVTFEASFELFNPLAFDLEGCFFLVLLSVCPVMAGRSKRFIQTFLSSGSCGQLHLEVSSFFVHCTKAQWFFNDFQVHGGFKLAPSWPTLAHVGPCWPK